MFPYLSLSLSSLSSMQKEKNEKARLSNLSPNLWYDHYLNTFLYLTLLSMETSFTWHHDCFRSLNIFRKTERTPSSAQSLFKNSSTQAKQLLMNAINQIIWGVILYHHTNTFFIFSIFISSKLLSFITRSTWETLPINKTFSQSMVKTLHWLRKKKHNLLEIWMFLVCKIRVLFTQGCFVGVQVWLKFQMKKMLIFVEISPLVLEKKIFRFRQYIFAISLAPSLEKERGPSFEQTWIPFTKGYFLPNLVVIGPLIA